MAHLSLAYPQTYQCDQIDEYHGLKVADRYRWLEDANSEQTQAWIAAQNQVTFSYLEQIPGREKLKQCLTKVWNHEKYGIPFKMGDRYFYYKNDGLQNHYVLYTLKSLHDEPRVLIDPNTLSADGTIAVSGIAVTENGKLIAYGISHAGSDWQEWKIKDVETGIDLPDHIQWVKFSGSAWTHDNAGFFYSRYNEPEPDSQLEEVNYYQKLCYHRLGTPQSEDLVIYERPDQKEWGFSGGVTEDGKYLIISVWKGTDPRNLVFYQDLTVANAPVVELINEFEAEYGVIDNEGTLFWVQTNYNAPKRRVIAIDINQPQEIKEIIPESNDTLQGVTILNHQFVCFYLKDAHTQIKVFDLEGNFIREIALPGLGSASGFSGKKHDTETFYSYTSYNTPPTIYHYDMVTDQSTIYQQPKIQFNSEDYETKQVFYESKDGTKIPMFITHKKGLVLDGNNPTYLYGYGGFNAAITPYFSISMSILMKLGWVYVIANLRGGGEYGEAWHQAGTKLNKQNVFDDFIAAAEWLIKEKYTNPKRMAIAGASNGGLLVGACMTQRPDLFGVALPAVGVMDMLRFHKFTIGWAWISDFGSPDNEEEFKAIYAYSPLHNLQEGTNYPATLITTADHDDRVVPAHSFKFAAALQAAHRGDNPVLIRIETRAGHGAGKPTTKLIEEITDQLVFAMFNMDVHDRLALIDDH